MELRHAWSCAELLHSAQSCSLPSLSTAVCINLNLQNIKAPTVKYTEVFEKEISLEAFDSNGFHCNFCKWACLHRALGACEPRSASRLGPKCIVRCTSCGGSNTGRGRINCTWRECICAGFTCREYICTVLLSLCRGFGATGRWV